MNDSAFAGRAPTSHEQRAGVPWDASYQDGPAPWDIGRPQPGMVRLAAAGGLEPPVLDVGCGTGDNALYLASLGLPVLGVDVAQTAIALARDKAVAQGMNAQFMVADALGLRRLNRTFATVIDAGLFHTFDRRERDIYAASLAAVTKSGGVVYVLCFSDRGERLGPHPVSEADLRMAFSTDRGWRMKSIVADSIETRVHDECVAAWLATVRRI